MLAIMAVLGVIAGVQDIGGLGVLDRAEAGLLTVEEADAFDVGFAAMGLLQFVAIVVTAIAYLAWLSRSVDNVPGLGGGKPVATPAWSIGWWFIPIANLFKPYQIVVDLYRRMAPVEKVGTGIVGAWWVLWLLNNVVAQAAGRFFAGDTIESIRSGVQLYAVSDFGDVVTAGLAIVIVLRIQRWADARLLAPVEAETEAGVQVAPVA
jgi:hypothetical protein